MQRYKKHTTPPNDIKPYQLAGTYTDIAEVVKSMFEAGILKGSQTAFFNDLCGILQIKTANLKDLIKGIRRRKGCFSVSALEKMKDAIINWELYLEEERKKKEIEKIKAKKSF